MKILATIGLLILLSGCSPHLSVYSDADPDYDLWTYQTFGWSDKTNIEANNNPIYYNELNDKRIKSAVARELTDRGYRLTDKSPEIIIHYHIVVQDQMNIITESYGYSYSPYWLLRRDRMVSYREGSLLIDIMDEKSKNLIWRGWAVAPIDRTYPPEQTERLINLAIEKIFRKFPGHAKLPAITKSSGNSD